MADFLLELLSEEIPARMQAKASADLARLFQEQLAAVGLKAGAIETYATPRRLALIARGLPAETAAVSEEIKRMSMRIRFCNPYSPAGSENSRMDVQLWVALLRGSFPARRQSSPVDGFLGRISGHQATNKSETGVYVRFESLQRLCLCATKILRCRLTVIPQEA